MAAQSIQAIAELVWRVLYPNGGSQTAVKKEEVVAMALTEYAAAMFIKSKEDQQTSGYFEIPSYLLTEKVLPVKDNAIDISELNLLRSLSSDQAIQDVGGLGCDCKYIKSSLNMEKKTCGDDSIGNSKTYFLLGKKIVFPKGTHAKELPIIYVNNGSEIDAKTVEADEYVSTKVRDKLFQIYGVKVPADHTANSNSNN